MIAATIPVTLFNNACLNLIQPPKTAPPKELIPRQNLKKTPPVFILVRKKDCCAFLLLAVDYVVMAFGYTLFSFKKGSLLSIIAPTLRCFTSRAEPKGRLCFIAALLADCCEARTSLNQKGGSALQLINELWVSLCYAPFRLQRSRKGKGVLCFLGYPSWTGGGGLHLSLSPYGGQGRSMGL